MTVAVLGPGAIGGSLAVRLALAGEHVLCVARPETAAAIRDEGITLVEDGRELRARPGAVETLSEPVQLLLVTVKAPHLEDALERVQAEPRTVLPLLNGLEHMAVLRARFASVTAATIGRLEAFREGQTHIVQRHPARITVAGDAPPPELARAGLEVRAVGSEADVLWEKLARQAPIAALTAVTGGNVGEVRADPRLRTATEEACAVAVADGARTTLAEQWSIIETLPPELTTSTARDVAAGRPSEMDAIVGAVTRAGRRLGVPTPTLDQLLAECPA
ncbi:MAG TPA: 2-dehydropantoate 2-reductase [Gaiellaceae bacterium]|nr:2-dehydropantoate 2-reductase [Gaiellaceae bacterium]